MNRNNFVYLVSKYWWWVALLCGPSLAHAATAPALLTNSTYGVVSSTWNDTSSTPVTGAGCTTTLTGTPTVTVGVGAPGIEVPCPPQRGLDQGTALATLTGQLCTSLSGGAVVLDTVNLGSGAGVFPPGCYSSGGAMSIGVGATVTLNGSGVYVFKTTGGAPATLGTAANSTVAVSGGACESDVFWAPGGATTLGATSTFRGTIIDAAGITVGTTTNIIGRLLSFGGVVNTVADTITVPTCVSGGGGGGGGGGNTIPTLSEWGMIILAGLLALFGFVAVRRQAR